MPTGLGLTSLLIYSLFFFYYVITISNLGVFLVVVPLWEIFLLIISGSLVVAASAAYSLASTRKRGIAIGGVEGTTTFILGRQS